jgi:3-dehydroquinate synthase
MAAGFLHMAIICFNPGNCFALGQSMLKAGFKTLTRPDLRYSRDVLSLTVQTSTSSYKVDFVNDLMNTRLPEHKLVFSDQVIPTLYTIPTDANVSLFEAAEEYKNLDTCQWLLKEMNRVNFAKDDTLLVFGGGTTQDIATLCASIYMRGVNWIFIPTTLMSMVDSCIGGKSSINLQGTKNLVGNIYPPGGVVIDPSFTKTLDLVSCISGLCEAVKICFAGGTDAFVEFLDFNVTPQDFRSHLVEDKTSLLVKHVLTTKKVFVEGDEFDGAERQLLNFGHTFGHALEVASNFVIPHGIAIGLGMIAAIHHPLTVTSRDTQALEQYLLQIIKQVDYDLNLSTIKVDWKLFRQCISRDKKATNNDLRIVIPGRSGKLEIVSVLRNQKSLDDLELCMKTALKW